MLSKIYQFWCDHHVMIISVIGAIVAWVDGKGVARKYLEQADAAAATAREKYLAMKKEAKARHLLEKATMAFQFVNKLSRTTESKVDDKVARGMEKAIEFLKKAGFGDEDIDSDSKDIILGHFDQLHEAEKRLLGAVKVPLV